MSDAHLGANDLAEATRLIDQLLDENLPLEGARRLEQMLRESADVRRLYVLQMHLWCGAMPYAMATYKTVSGPADVQATAEELSDVMILPAITGDAEETIGDEPNSESGLDHTVGTEAPPIVSQELQRGHVRRLNLSSGLAAAIVLVAGVALTIVLYQLGIFGGNSPQPIAMGPSLDAIWADPDSAVAPGTLIKTGVPQSLTSGYAQLTSPNGLVVVIQGPTTFTVEAAGIITLASGRLTASVPKPARGFTVNTPHAHVVDLGTEFGVAVSATGETDIETFRGTVSLTSTASPPSAPASLITAGIARRVNSFGDIKEIPANTTTFFRPQQFDDLNALPQGSPFERWKSYSERLRHDPDLVAYYTFDAGEESADRLPNRSSTGSELDGILGGADTAERPSWTTGRWPEKSALAFARGTHQRVEVPASIGSPLDFSGGQQSASPFTICVWVRGEKSDTDASPIVSESSPDGDEFLLEATRLEQMIRARVPGPPPEGFAESPSCVLDGTWQHVAMRYDPQHGNLQLFLNGVLIATTNDVRTQLPQDDETMIIGCRHKYSISPTAYFPSMIGRIDELAIFRRALSAEQLRNMYQAEKPS